jgi:7-cyano-7-deazaguanine synthase
MSQDRAQRGSPAVVLLSSGLDSSVCLYASLRRYDVRLALTIDYGQRAARREIERSRELADRVGVKHLVLELQALAGATRTSLVNRAADVPEGHEVDLNSHAASERTAERVWVPNRNGLFLNLAAAYAEAFAEPGRPAVLVPGFNREEASTFPDNSAAFVEAANQALVFSTMGRVRVECPTIGMDKVEIHRWGVELGVPMDRVWPCYFDFDDPCGRCESCQRFLRAQKASTQTGRAGHHR